MKELMISFFDKNGQFPRGIYYQRDAVTWSLAVYFRKAKDCDVETYEKILEWIKNSKERKTS